MRIERSLNPWLAVSNIRRQRQRWWYAFVTLSPVTVMKVCVWQLSRVPSDVTLRNATAAPPANPSTNAELAGKGKSGHKDDSIHQKTLLSFQQIPRVFFSFPKNCQSIPNVPETVIKILPHNDSFLCRSTTVSQLSELCVEFKWSELARKVSNIGFITGVRSTCHTCLRFSVHSTHRCR